MFNFHEGGRYSYRNQSIDLLCKSMDWFLYDIGLRHERVKLYCAKLCHRVRCLVLNCCPKVLCKKGVQKISQNSQENTFFF